MKHSQPSRVLLAHGGGGQLTDDLVAEAVLSKLANPALDELLDSGMVAARNAGRLALTIDSYVVQPLFFPGGDIGRLAVCGTVNDLAVTGATPLGIALSLILEEGLERSVLDRVIASVKTASDEAGVPVVTGDTKVVGKGAGDGVYITTSGVGLMPSTPAPHPDRVGPGEAILINGPIADHGMAVMLARQLPEVKSPVTSDVLLNGLIAALREAVSNVCFMRDATRGGLAGVCVDLARRTGLHIVLEENAIGVQPHTRHIAEMLGVDVLEVANEGKLVAVVPATDAAQALAAMRAHPLGRHAAIIGYVTAEQDGLCELHTTIGGRRIVQKPYGEQLPRIC